MPGEQLLIQAVIDFKAAEKQIKDLTSKAYNVPISVTADDAQAEASLTKTVRKRRSAKVDVEADTNSAEAEINKTTKRRSAKVNVEADTHAAEAEVGKTTKRRSAKVKVDADTAEASKDIDKLGKKKVKVKVDSETTDSASSGAGGVAQKILKGLSSNSSDIGSAGKKIGGKLGDLLGSISDKGDTFGKLAESLSGVGSGAAAAEGGVSGLAGAMGGAASMGSSLLSALGPVAVAVAAVTVAMKVAQTAIDTTMQGLAELEDLSNNVRSIHDVTGTTATDASELLGAFKGLANGMEVSAGDINDVLLNIQQKAKDGSLAALGIKLDPGASAVDNLYKIADAYKAAGDDATKAAIASAALGEQGARQFVPLIKDGSEALRDLMKAVPEGIRLTQADLDAQAQLAKSKLAFGQQFESMRISIAKQVTPALELLYRTLAKFGPELTALGEAFGRMASFVVSKITSMIVGLTTMTKAAASLAHGDVSGAWDALKTGLNETVEAQNQANRSLFDWSETADSASESTGGLAGAMGQVADNTQTAADKADVLRQKIEGALSAAQTARDAVKGVQDASKEIDAIRNNSTLTNIAGTKLKIDAKLDIPPDEVKALQENLNRLGANVKVDGLIGPETLSSIDAQFATRTDEVQKAIESATQQQQIALFQSVNSRIQQHIDIPESEVSNLQRVLATLDPKVQVTGELDPLTQQVLQAQLGHLTGLQVDVGAQARDAADKIANAVQTEVQASVDSGAMTQSEGLNNLVQRISDIRSLNIAAGIDPAFTAELDLLLSKLQQVKHESEAVVAGPPNPNTIHWSNLLPATPISTTATVDTAPAVTSMDQMRTDEQAKPVTVTANADVTQAVSAINAAAADRMSTIMVNVTGLNEFIDKLNGIKDKTVKAIVDWSEINRPQGFRRGGPVSKGNLIEVAEDGPELFVGGSGLRIMIPDRTFWRPPESGRILTAAQTSREVRTVRAPRSYTNNNVGDITVISPHPLLAGRDVHRALKRRFGGSGE